MPSRKIVSIITTTVMGRARWGTMMWQKRAIALAPSMRAASICSRSSDCMAVSRIRVAKGTHCQATMMPTENSGMSVNQVDRRRGRPSGRR